MAVKGMRTLGFAIRNMSADDSRLIFIGIVGIADPIRNDVRQAIDTCSGHAGVRVIMVTGDNALTASEIARQAGIIGANETNPLTITGPEFAAKSDEYLKKGSDSESKGPIRAVPTTKSVSSPCFRRWARSWR